MSYGLLLVLVSGCGDIALRGTVDDLSTKDPVWRFYKTIVCPTAGDDIHFGQSVSINGDFIAIGAPGENGERGAVYTYAIGSDGIASSPKKLVVAGASGGEDFGMSVSLTRENNLNRLAVGAPGESADAGAVYLFESDASNWDPLVGATGKLDTAGITLNGGDSFGCSVSISGGYLLIGEFGDSSGRGTAHIFDAFTLPTVWDWRTTLSTAGLDMLDFYGYAVSISGSYSFIGAYRDETGAWDESGKVYIFKKDAVGDDWSALAPNYIEAGDPKDNGHFGYSVCVFGNVAVVGAPGSGNNAVYVFERDADNWDQTQKISQPDGAATDDFGSSVSLEDGLLVAGAYQHNYKALEDGAAYLFEEFGSSWSSQGKYTVNSPSDSDHFGAAVGIFGEYIVVGVPNDDENGTDSGSVYIYRYY
jgi:hypothetical protein